MCLTTEVHIIEHIHTPVIILYSSEVLTVLLHAVYMHGVYMTYVHVYSLGEPNIPIEILYT